MPPPSTGHLPGPASVTAELPLDNDKATRAAHGSLKLLIAIPVRDDWESLAQVISRLNAALAGEPVEASIVIIDDYSIQTHEALVLDAGATRAFRELYVLRLRRNLGHQRAICIGLAYIGRHMVCDAVLVMDGDGEDCPEDVPRLIEAFNCLGGAQVVFAERIKRSEGVIFTVFYHLYRGLHRILTGIPVRVGNFSIMPSAMVPTVAVLSEMWNHYAAAIVKARLPYIGMPTPRGRRIAGHPRMNFTALVTHGLSAYAVFAEAVTVRVLLSALAGALVSATLMIGVVSVRLFTAWAIPGWATVAGLAFALLTIQFLSFAGAVTFIVLVGRNAMGFLPARDFEYFVERVTRITP